MINTNREQETAVLNNLPTYQPTLVDRADECQEVSTLLKTKRLITIVGPGGIGKTSLALALASKHLSGFSHGIYFISLAEVVSPLFLVSSIAEAIHFPYHESKNFKQDLLDYLHDRHILLILDNYEHLLPNTNLILAILQSTKRVHLLVTSRHHLNLREETIYQLHGLSFPQAKAEIQANNYSAIQFFVLRAQTVNPHFVLTPHNLPDVISICQLVDGLPLALELAANWTRALSCQEIAQQVSKDLDFLATAWQDIPDRHQAIRNVLAQSWDLLDDPTRSVLRKLAIFQGHINLKSAQQVAKATPHILASLIDQSMLQYDPADTYQTHPLMQQYAHEKLVEAQEFETTSEHFCDYFVDFLQHQETKIPGAKQHLALEQIGAVIENIRQAWTWAVTANRETQIMKSMEGLFQFYLLRGYFLDGETCFSQAAQHLSNKQNPPNKSLIVSKLLVRQGIFCRRLGHYAKAKSTFQKQLLTLEELEAQAEITICLKELTYIAYRQSAYEEATSLGLDCLSRCQKMNDTSGSVGMYHILSNIARETAQYDQAHQYLEDALALSNPNQSPRLHAKSLQNMGVFFNHRGDFEKAINYYKEALIIFQEIEDQPGEGLILSHLGAAYTNQARFQYARQCYEKSLPILQEIGDQQSLGRALGILGIIFQKLGLVEQAQTNFEQSLHILRKIGEKRGLCVTLSNISHHFYQYEDFTKAQTYAEKFLTLACAMENATAQGYAYTNLGNALRGQGNLSDAETAYRHAIEQRRSIKEQHLNLEPIAGLADIALTKRNLPLALEFVETLLTANADWDKCEENLPEILYICYRALEANQDERADDILNLVYQRLKMQADKIDDQALQRSFLETVPIHKKIVHAFIQANRQQTIPSTNSIIKFEPGLTPRELEVLQWVEAGRSNQEIADGLCISLSTVKRHITNVHHKLGVKRRTQAISRARELGLL